ncbi:putative membrane protein [Clostridium bornimense]|uniref:Putative membrane protein n=1 Tax=Clostridium bornimense TaxID=1216932 RepID=W6SFP0_9CLOT|nr:type II secretion system protein [Clostridium bornimense]CDM68500.1 putative membrane protein [Clostridium bornimense]
MAVVAIIAILAVVLVPTVTGYINRAKKLAIISQARVAVNAVRNSNALGTGAYYIQEDADCCIVKDLIVSVQDEE